MVNRGLISCYVLNFKFYDHCPYWYIEPTIKSTVCTPKLIEPWITIELKLSKWNFKVIHAIFNVISINQMKIIVNCEIIKDVWDKFWIKEEETLTPLNLGTTIFKPLKFQGGKLGELEISTSTIWFEDEGWDFSNLNSSATVVLARPLSLHGWLRTHRRHQWRWKHQLLDSQEKDLELEREKMK